MEPIYTVDNCHPSYKLNWSFTLFWRSSGASPDWLNDLVKATEKDGVRILNHHRRKPQMDQFLLSTRPQMAPQAIIRIIKGRLYAIIRINYPKPFQRNYSLNSVGYTKREVVENYVLSQLRHHQMADKRIQERLHQFQINNPEVDLSQVQRSSHGTYSYNIHLVLVNEGRWMNVREDILKKIRTMVVRVSEKKGYRLSACGIFPDHIHITVGCKIDQSPSEVALAYLNNLAWCQGMVPVYQRSYYVGTFGEYDLAAMK